MIESGYVIIIALILGYMRVMWSYRNWIIHLRLSCWQQ